MPVPVIWDNRCIFNGVLHKAELLDLLSTECGFNAANRAQDKVIKTIASAARGSPSADGWSASSAAMPIPNLPRPMRRCCHEGEPNPRLAHGAVASPCDCGPSFDLPALFAHRLRSCSGDDLDLCVRRPNGRRRTARHLCRAARL